MSALFGIWNLDGRPVEAHYLRQVAALLAPQGPDREATYAKDNFGIVYSAFHTTKESHHEVQPHVTRSGVVVNWEGRLDNREELGNDLAELDPNNVTDIAIAALSFDRWGTQSFARLTGDWAISVWDPATRTLFLAKDYIGIRHLYYLPHSKRVLWSTCLETMVRMSGCSLTVNDEYVAGYLANSPDAHLTPYREIQAVAPGGFVTIRNGTAVPYRYWSFQPKHKITYNSDPEYEDHFRHLFRQAVRRRLRSDCPILGQLSGGVDSSSIICMADDIINAGETDAIRLDTLSTFDPKEPEGDERVYFTKIEEHRGRTGYHLNRDAYGHVFDLDYTSLVVAPGSSAYRGKLREDLLRLFHGQGYRVLLSGIGGDELLGGVPNPLSQLADLIVLPRPIQLVKQLTAWSLVKKRPCIQLLGQTLVTLLPPSMRAMVSGQSKAIPWIHPAFSRREKLSVRQLGPTGGHGFWRPSRRESARTLVALARQMARIPAHGIACEERRYPFLDQSLVEFLLAIPASQLLRPRQRRSLMRRALTGLVPTEILWRKTKAFVNRGVLVAFGNSWQELENIFDAPLSGALGYVEPARLLGSLHAARNGDASHMMYLLTAVSLEVWLRSVTSHGVIQASFTSPRTAQQPVVQLGA